MDWGLSCRSGPPTHLRDGLSLPSKILSCDTGPPFQIFVVVRQNWGNYTLSPHIKYQKHISIKFKKMINWHYKDKLFFHKRYWQEKEKLYRLGENTNHISNKGFISKIYKELNTQQYTHTHTHTHKSLFFKWAKYLNKYFTKEDIQKMYP